MIKSFFELAAQFATSDDEDDPLSKLSKIMDQDGKQAFSRELKAVSLLKYRRESSRAHDNA